MQPASRLFLAATLFSFSLWTAPVPTPKEHLGYEPGADYKLADYKDLIGYFQKVAAVTDRMKLVEFGKTSEGRPTYLAIISSPENLAKLDRLKEMNRRLALGKATEAELPKLLSDGKVFVWIDSGLHATEVAPAQHSPELLYQMVTGETEEHKRIRDKVILLQVPCINPDGLDAVSHWYRKNVGSLYEHAPLPVPYQKYADHDNNRDWFMMNLPETRNVSRLLFQEFFPQILYNQHQAPAFPARIFVPPYAEPLNPNIPAPVMEGINLIGAAMKERFAREEKPGILSYYQFDAWWNGGLRSVPAFHNMHGILTETALYSYATPKDYKVSELPERFAGGIPTKHPTVFYERPWLGGKWGVRQAIDYMLTADFAILDLASTRSEAFLRKSWEMARRNMELGSRGAPYAYIVPMDQADKHSAQEMVRRLRLSGVQIQRASAPFTFKEKTYPAGTFVIPAGQPFRGYVVDLMEPQNYPELRAGNNGPARRPYDVAGWTLPMLMGVKVDRADDRFQATLTEVESVEAGATSTDLRDNGSLMLTADLLREGKNVRWTRDGKVVTEGQEGFASAAYRVGKPRVGVYDPWTNNMDAGWTKWVLDNFRVPHSSLRNEDLAKGGLRARFDTIILASQAQQSILHGIRAGERAPFTRAGMSDDQIQQRPEYTGGIGLAGLAELERFVRDGGQLITFDQAGELPVRLFPLPLRAAVTGDTGGREDGAPSGYYCPGSLLRATVDTSNPIALGMPADAIVFSSGGQAWDITLLEPFNKDQRATRSVARYATKDILASGYLAGERTVAGKSLLIEAQHGSGKVLLFGFRPQFRGQTYGTFRLVLNAIYLHSGTVH
ncbi:MAG TPA: M14 metallopeptidase family protein [Bryobacteraceae bacterium]|nr:M14 metallopeptidase family protein [Bryobacteraceae bacterium]